MSNPLKQRKEVMLLRQDKRFTTLTVEKETDEIVYCKKKDGIMYRFFKLGPGWTEKIVRFLAVEGTPLITYLAEPTQQAKATLEEYLRLAWGDDAFNGLPSALRDVLDRKVGIIVTVKPIMPDENMKGKFNELKADGMLYDSDLENLSTFGIAKERRSHVQNIMDKLPWIMAGIGLQYILNDLGILG